VFSQIKSFLLKLFTDFQSTFIWIFAIGILFCALMVWMGDEHNAPKFKKGLMTCVFGLIIFLLAKQIIQYIDGSF
jgi:stage V sporulation protein AE